MDRRDFLRLAGGAAVAAAGIGCSGGGSGDTTPTEARPAPADAGSNAKSKGRRTLRIAQVIHFVPAYDAWFDNEYVTRWGDEHDVDVLVEHISINELALRADAEGTAGRGHDLFGLLNPRPTLEDKVIDHREIVEELTAKLGPLTPHVERSILNPKTGRYFGFCDYWSAAPSHYRVDLWNQISPGLRPATWDDVRRAGVALKADDHPLGFGISADLDSNWTLNTLMHSYGSAIQDGDANLTVNTPATVEAVKVCAEIYRTGMTEDVFTWDASSNNRLLTSGRGSLILNAISALRAAEQQDAQLAANIALVPTPTGPTGDVPRCAYAVDSYVIWRFSPNQDLAKQFLIDLALSYEPAFVASRFYNLPAFPGSVPGLAGLVASDSEAQPADKYALLADAASWSTNVGHPGTLNAAVDEVFDRFLVSRMFAAAARGELSAEDAVARAEAEMRPIFKSWRERGKI